MRRARLLLATCGLLAGLIAAPARADVFGPISLVSANGLEQADYAHDAVVSGDGRFVVFDGSVGSVTGVWRKNLANGELQQVAGGDAQFPSVSSDGNYVSFTTNEGGHLGELTDGLPHTPTPFGEAPNVYVRDMSVEAQAAGAFAIVSAPSGSDEPLSYEAVAGGSGAAEQFGALAAGRSAISADGTKVVFVTTAVSNLTRYPKEEAEEVESTGTSRPHTPPLQVAVRDIPSSTTRLVSVRRDPSTGAPAIDPETGEDEPVATASENGERGAVLGKGGLPPFRSRRPFGYEIGPQIGASISADGTTVAWMGQQLGEQVASLPGEPLRPLFTAPLWRRIGDGEGAPTRLVTGGPDPESPACAASGETHLPGEPNAADPCQGPFETREHAGTLGVWSAPASDDEVPQLSGDGYTVLFVANAPLIALRNESPGEASDLFLADMTPGLTQRQALVPLTQVASTNEQSLPTNAPVTDYAISANASVARRQGEIAFTTDRTVFPLGSPAYISTHAPVAGMNEVYDVDLGENTLTRVTQGYEGGPSEHPLSGRQPNEEDPYFLKLGAEDGALSPSFSEDGNLLAFTSTASNLAFGDDNTPSSEATKGEPDGSDAFTTSRVLFNGAGAENTISPPPPNPALLAPWKLAVTTQSLSDGRVRLFLSVPGAGALSAAASGSVPVKATSARKRRHGAHPASVRRTLASAGLRARGGFTTVVLTLSSRYRALATRKGGVPASVSVSFSAPGHPSLRVKVNVRFVVIKKHKAKR